LNNTRHLIISVFLLAFIITIGTAGYITIEGWNIIDAVYMTVITLTTVGYGEVHEVSKTGRVYTIFLIFWEPASLFMLQVRSSSSWLKAESESYWGGRDWTKR